MKRCLRCGQDSDLSAIGEMLFNFVCDVCRHDKNGWEFNGMRTKDMEYEMPEPDKLSRWKKAKEVSNEYQ